MEITIETIDLKVKNDIEKKIVTINGEILDFDMLQSLATQVIDEGKKLNVIFDGFDDMPDIKKYYEDLFNEINLLKNDPQIIETKKHFEESK